MRRLHPILVVACLAGGCSDGGNNTDAGSADGQRVPQGYGSQCEADSDCTSGLCVDKYCSQVCKRLSECPSVGGKPFDCGEVADKKKIACYPRNYKTVQYTLGHDCSINPTCAVGYTCMGQEGASDRYCSAKCKSDRDCPPRYRCAAVRNGTQAPETDKWCRRRELCHPCVIDDQCGPDNLCITDVNGNKYCSKSCTKTGGTCPPWAKCEDAGNGKLQCKHRKGYCYKPDGGTLCDGCIMHGWVGSADADYTIAEVGTCKAGGFCYLLTPYTMEAVCIMPPSPTSSSAKCDSGDVCPSSDYGCATLQSLGGKFCVPIAIDPETGETIFGSCAAPAGTSP